MRVLVVEDDDETRELIAMVLREINSVFRVEIESIKGAFEVDTAATNDDALRLYRNSGPYGLVMTDIGHPGSECGDVLIDAIRKSDPMQPIIVETAQPPEVTDSIWRSYPDIPVVEKRCLGELLKTVKALVSAASRKSHSSVTM